MVYESLIYDDTSIYEEGTAASHSDSTGASNSSSSSCSSFMGEYTDSDSEYNPGPAMVGDLHHGQDIPIIDHLLNGCLTMLEHKYSSFSHGIAESTIGSPSIDCDAFSFIITTDPSGNDFTLDREQRMAIKRFLCTFSQPLATVSFPLSEVAANKTDSMFG